MYITQQPQHFDIPNGFGLMGNEHPLHGWVFEEGCEGCCGITYYTILTDIRLLTRFEEHNPCNCSSKSDHMDSSIFLRDISQMQETTESKNCCSNLCEICCCAWCGACCCQGPKYVEVRGTFGSHKIHMSKPDILNAQVEIPAAIANHKLATRA